MTTPTLSYVGLPSVAIADGAAAPDPGLTGVLAWSTTENAVVQWDGSAWSIVASSTTFVSYAAIQGIGFFFDPRTQQEAGYYTLNRSPQPPPSQLITATTNSAADVLAAGFETQVNDPYVTSLPAGTYNFHGFGYRASGGGTYYVVAKFYTRTAGGTETLLFEIVSDAIVATSAASPTEWDNEYYLAAPVAIALDTRLVVKIYVRSSGTARVVNLLTQGTTTASHVITPLLGQAGTPPTQNPNTIDIGKVLGIGRIGVVTY